MLEAQIKSIGGKDFQFSPLPVLKAARLDKRIVGLLVPILGGLKGITAKQEERVDMDLDSLARGLRSALEGLPDAEYEGMLVQLLSSVAYLPSGGAPIELNDGLAIDRAFSGDLVTLYKVAFEVMRFNKFTPFAFATIGGPLSKMLGSNGVAGVTSVSKGA